MTAGPDQLARPRTPSASAPRAATHPAIQSVLADAHAHYYPAFGWDRFLDAATRNFTRAAAHPAARCLLFAERAEDDELHRLLTGRGRDLPRRWTIARTPEPGSLIASHADTHIHLIAGRQLRTAESLELLALCTDRRFPDGLPIAQALQAAAAADALPVLPWGLGKWWFRRGRVIAQLIRPQPHPVFFGDTSSRPAHTPAPRHFCAAARAGWHVLPGADPLPHPAEATIAGSYGFAIDGPFDPDHPAASLRALLTAPTAEPRPFGRRRSLPGVVRSQLALRFAPRSAPTGVTA